MAAKAALRRKLALVSLSMAAVYVVIITEVTVPIRVRSIDNVRNGELNSESPVEENVGGFESSLIRKSGSANADDDDDDDAWQRRATLKRLMSELFPLQARVPFDEYQLNVSASNVIAVDRLLPDYRSDACRRSTSVMDEKRLPDATVIIPFHDESWSMLLRTVHGVLDRSPPELIRELILVDDFSTYQYLGRALDRYMETLDRRRIRIIRNRKRLGLVRARLVAAEKASGDVLVFLDAHVEVGHGWLQPLLRAVQRNRTTVFVPRVDSIDPHTIDYTPWPYHARGGFTWALNYVWKFMRSSEEADIHPYQTATTIGCAMAVDRHFFFRFGAFDDGMSIWGGENIELSIRAWTCAGGVYVVPCSRVGHVFRHHLPYKFPVETGGRGVVLRNYQRLVEVWFDDHRKYYYVATGTRRRAEREVAVDVADRRRLRDRLQCRSFDWFMNNVLTDLGVPQPGVAYYGQLKNAYGRMCMRWNVDNGGFGINTTGDLRKLVLEPCGYHDPSDTFSYFAANRSIVHAGSGLCVTATARGLVVLDDCRASQDGTRDRSSQIWKYDVMHGPSSSSNSASGSTVQAEAVARDLVLRSPDATDTDKPVGRLTVELSSVFGLEERKLTLCLAQLTWSDGRQVAGTLGCDDRASSQDNLFTFWVFTYELNWTVLS